MAEGKEQHGQRAGGVFPGLRPVSSFELTLGAEERIRIGQVAGFHASIRERIVTAGVAFVL